ncbi:hypothetical protein ZIOFF_046886 [Zingiber officinale]|uniref:Cupin type-1 domain-containing protein n=1 Tax=Zingiber officinale TaxID=94328 RepID=A0A8J5KTB0_ZINOF|nr:hypothetical protein ZIOFF_046886 [Zingiber officinale]
MASGLDKPGNTINKLGFNIRAVNVNTIPGLNTLGVSMARIEDVTSESRYDMAVKEEFREDGADEGAREGVDELVVREMEDVEARQGAKEVVNRPCEGSIDGGKVDESSRGSDVLGEAPGGEREIV